MRRILMLSVLALVSSGFAANCKKGKPCGGSCIPVASTCHIGSNPTPSLPITPPAPAPTPLPVSRVYTPSYGNCKDARAAGHSNMLMTDPNYHPDLDRDGDGIACEAGDDDGAVVRGWIPPIERVSIPTPALPPFPRLLAPTAGLTPYRVVKVEGTTLTLNSNYQDQQVRLAGVAPAAGREADLNAWIEQALPVGSLVLGEFDAPSTLTPNIYLWQSGQLLNAAPIGAGFGVVDPATTTRYLEHLQSVQAWAKAAIVGR